MTDLVLRMAIVSALAALIALFWVLRQNARRSGWSPRVATLDLTRLPVRTNTPVQLVAFTSPLCAPCKEIPRIALEAAPEVPLIILDVRDHPGLVHTLGIRTTPTLLLLDDNGRIRYGTDQLPEAAELWLYVREAWDSSAMTRSILAARPRRHGPQR